MAHMRSALTSTGPPVCAPLIPRDARKRGRRFAKFIDPYFYIHVLYAYTLIYSIVSTMNNTQD